MSSAKPHRALTELVGVYDADGTLYGELSYWIGARLGRRHCALCEITHGLFLPRAQWRRLSGDLPVPFRAVHLDERDPAVSSASGDTAPCVVAKFDDGTAELVADSREIEACQGDPDLFAGLLRRLGNSE